MSIIRSRKAPAAPTFQVLRVSNRHLVRDGWVWNICLVREADGTLAEYELPDHKLGAL
jgi:hypothetical protein